MQTIIGGFCILSHSPKRHVYHLTILASPKSLCCFLSCSKQAAREVLHVLFLNGIANQGDRDYELLIEKKRKPQKKRRRDHLS
jgi:hypothetical protein